MSRWRDTVFLREVSIGRPKEDENGHFSIYQQISRILSKNNQKKRKKKERERGKLRLNVRKHIHEDFDYTEIDHMVRKAI